MPKPVTWTFKVTWFLAAIISAFALSGQALFFQRLQKSYPMMTYYERR
ncbi:MAG: hypothetical protein Q9P01_21570 [Anaerolineae bacterium]|nr:hypothetical protein [Anaerolineae bacterium]